jgi:hypothetical protein
VAAAAVAALMAVSAACLTSVCHLLLSMPLGTCALCTTHGAVLLWHASGQHMRSFHTQTPQTCCEATPLTPPLAPRPTLYPPQAGAAGAVAAAAAGAAAAARPSTLPLLSRSWP